MLTTDKIDNRTIYEPPAGNLHVLGSIGSNADVTIRNGNLIVEGNIGDNSTIKCKSDTQIGSCSFFNNAPYTFVEIRGNVGSNVKIYLSVGDVTVKGIVGSHSMINIKFLGSIVAGRVDDHVSMICGDSITADDVGADTSMIVCGKAGRIRVNSIGDNTRLYAPGSKSTVTVLWPQPVTPTTPRNEDDTDSQQVSIRTMHAGPF
ncbi:MAG: hypothetical protein Q8R79_07490 [Legionellaceae bacterium]|nr:hypothetical protein [Legionellaceae bacterium]